MPPQKPAMSTRMRSLLHPKSRARDNGSLSRPPLFMLHHLLLAHHLAEATVVPMARFAPAKSPQPHAEDPSQRKPPPTLPAAPLPQPARTTRRTSLSKMMKRSQRLVQPVPRAPIAMANARSQPSSMWMPIHSRCTSCNKCK